MDFRMKLGLIDRNELTILMKFSIINKLFSCHE